MMIIAPKPTRGLDRKSELSTNKSCLRYFLGRISAGNSKTVWRLRIKHQQIISLVFSGKDLFLAGKTCNVRRNYLKTISSKYLESIALPIAFGDYE